MKFMRWFSAIAFTVILVIAALVWWNRPQGRDMAANVPADALVYLECNNILDVVEAITGTDAWKELGPLLVTNRSHPASSWLTRVISWTGIGPTKTVILSRAQVAMAMIDLGAKEQDETLTIKPEAAILIETHTGESRIRSTVEETLRLFAEKSYREPTLRRADVAGSEFLFWSTPTSARQIVSTIDGTLVIIGNSERVVKLCLEVRRGQRPSLTNHPEMQQMRRRLVSQDLLAFGFISSSNAARLFTLATPLLFGMAPGDTRFERIIGTGAPKVLAGIGWSSRSSAGGIEDHYLFSLQPTIVSHLQESFRPASTPIQVLEILPKDVHAITVYRFENPGATWEALGTSLSSQLDTLSAMLVSSLLKSALTPYGIDDPAAFLKLVGPEISTVRLTAETERSTLIAQVRDEASLKKLLLEHVRRNLKHTSVAGVEIIEIPAEEIAVSFLKARVLIGPTEDVRLHVEAAANNAETSDQLKKLEHFSGRSNSANVVTYTREVDRVMNFLQTISRASGSTTPAGDPTELSSRIERLPYSATETTLGDQGLERVTRSSFGQFATLVPLLFPKE